MTRMHRRLGLSLAVVTALLSAAEASGQTPLVDAARQERARRAAIPPDQKARVYTNEDLRDHGGLTIGALPGAAAEAPAVPAADLDAAVATTTDDGEREIGEPESGGVRDENYWRTRMSAARDAQARAALLAAALQNRADGLWAQFTAVDDPVQRGVVERQRIEALEAIGEMRVERDRLDREIRDLQEEARRADVPPGWLREAGTR